MINKKGSIYFSLVMLLLALLLISFIIYEGYKCPDRFFQGKTCELNSEEKCQQLCYKVNAEFLKEEINLFSDNKCVCLNNQGDIIKI